MVNLFVGYDPREACAFHVFCQSVIEHASTPVRIIPLSEKSLHFDGQQDGSNAFIYSRYLIPYLQNYEGYALFMDGDMVVNEDVADLWSFGDDFAVQVVKHEYRTANEKKYIGSKMESPNYDYPRKNWSSVILWNCGHPSNKILTKQFVAESGGAILHRFGWLKDDEIGSLPSRWNHLIGEYEDEQASVYHYTLGVPGFDHYQRCDRHREWNHTLMRALRLEGERPEEIVRRAAWRS